MKKALAFVCSLTIGILTAQSNPEIFLFDLKIENNTINIANPKNISNNEGYDSQPSFSDNNTLLYASTRNKQTDILSYTIATNTKTWISNTPGGEYSPVLMPNKKEISAIRLDKDGKQLLYRYAIETGESKPLVNDLVIGYHTWSDKKTIVSFVLGKPSSLVVSNIKNHKSKTFDTQIGRSFHKIPNSKLISYISKKGENWTINSLNPSNGKKELICNTLAKSEDMCWTPNGTILMGKDGDLYKFNPKVDENWIKIPLPKNIGLQKISRLTVSPDATKLAIVAEQSAEHIVQKQLDAYNARDINAFMATYTENIKIYNFPEKLSSEGQESMRKNYAGFFKNTPDLHCTIKKRICIGNKVIDHEEAIMNGKTFTIVAVYEVTDGLISKVTFIK